MTKPAPRTRRSLGGGVRGQGGGIIGIEGQKGEMMHGRDVTKMVFFLCIVRARTHEFAAKKTQGKNRTMQRHEQVLPPCHCIAQIEAGE
jgi:hypothetical protein